MVPTDPATPPRVVRRFDALAGRVFDAWLDPAIVGRWLFATPEGVMSRVEVDARVGASYAIVEIRDGAEVEHVGEYLEIDRPRRLVFTLRVPKYSQDEARITIDIVALDSGCELTLNHDRLDPSHADKAREGWGKVLANLAAALG